MEKLKESYQILEELLRTANTLISPISYHDDLNRLTPEFMTKDYEKTPGCYLRIATGQNHAFFPICTRNGAKSPEMINFSLKLARKMSGTKNVDEEELKMVIAKLDKMHKKYSKPIPNTVSQAALKGLATKRFNTNMR